MKHGCILIHPANLTAESDLKRICDKIKYIGPTDSSVSKINFGTELTCDSFNFVRSHKNSFIGKLKLCFIQRSFDNLPTAVFTHV